MTEEKRKQLKLPKKNGMSRCPNCGSSDTKFNIHTGLVNCLYCRAEYEAEKVNAKGGVRELSGDHAGDGSADIIPGQDVILTYKCPGCGAEVVINVAQEYSARCHWCRHVFNVNEKIANGAVPDMVLPFKIKQDAAEKSIRDFVNKRSFFAHPKFKKEFKASNVMGVFLPYLVVDINARAEMSGSAEHTVRSYSIREGKHTVRVHDVETYNVSRKFNLLVDDLVVEASTDKLKQDIHSDTKNVINAIMPFDTENCVDWSPSYLDGFTSERRDVNIADLKKVVQTQLGDVARYKVKETMSQYGRGAHWDKEEIDIKGTLWKTAYLPVWIYSYLQNDKNQRILHYVVVNGRTGETMGSVPVNNGKLALVTLLIEAVSIALAVSISGFVLNNSSSILPLLLVWFMAILPGIIFYSSKMSKYRNMGARFVHEQETESNIENVESTDLLINKRIAVRTSSMQNRNDNRVEGILSKNNSLVQNTVIEQLGLQQIAEDIVKDSQ